MPGFLITYEDDTNVIKVRKTFESSTDLGGAIAWWRYDGRYYPELEEDDPVRNYYFEDPSERKMYAHTPRYRLKVTQYAEAKTWIVFSLYFESPDENSRLLFTHSINRSSPWSRVLRMHYDIVQKQLTCGPMFRPLGAEDEQKNGEIDGDAEKDEKEERAKESNLIYDVAMAQVTACDEEVAQLLLKRAEMIRITEAALCLGGKKA